MFIPHFLSVVLVLVVLPRFVYTADGDEAPVDCIIVASHDSAVFAVAQPILFTVTYLNDSDEPWTLYKPDECTCVSIRAVSDNPYHARVGFSLGKFRVAETEVIVARIAEIPPELTIDPREGYSFEVILNPGFRSALRAGSWNFSVTDRTEKLNSDTVPFTIVVTRDSVDRCLEVMNEELLDRYARGWHGGYLARVRPDLPFDFSGRDRTPEELTEVRTNNPDALGEFNAWWAEHRDSEEVEEALERINEEAGVLEEYRALREELAAAAAEEEDSGEGNKGGDKGDGTELRPLYPSSSPPRTRPYSTGVTPTDA